MPRRRAKSALPGAVCWPRRDSRTPTRLRTPSSWRSSESLVTDRWFGPTSPALGPTSPGFAQP
ncbi:MAG TPA: hypothetical protein EYP98_17025, partial [Planctomycetes bacterium]|nr:hypothetical protein [Planctomycetota bacterium]